MSSDKIYIKENHTIGDKIQHLKATLLMIQFSMKNIHDKKIFLYEISIMVLTFKKDFGCS